MTVEQTVEIPATRRITFDLPISFPVGTAKVAIVSKDSPPEELPKVTRAQWAQWAEERKNDPIWQVLDQPVELDWSWLPEGKTPETVTKEDFRALAIKEKYGI
jgi:hypothetical protein